MIVYPGVESAGCFGSQFSVEPDRGLCVTSTRIGVSRKKTLYLGLCVLRSPFFVEKERERMDLLQQAAAAWKELTEYTYRITYGKSCVLHEILLGFDRAEFYHLAGFQHLKDIAFPVRFPHAKTIDVILSGKLTEADIAKSENYESIRERLTAITKLKAGLDTSFTVYQFKPDSLPFSTRITAEHLISAECGDLVFLFTDKENGGRAFSKSIFLKRPGRDFRQNQKALAVLKVERENGETICLYSR